MWGYKNYLNRILADKIFEKFINRDHLKRYLKWTNFIKGYDQYFLRRFVYSDIRYISVIHDSYLCKKYKDSIPYPTQRVGPCFIGASGCNMNKTSPVCPIECRPKNHLEWTTC